MRSTGRRLSKAIGDPLWFKDAIIYEAHIRAFADSDADGMGDFRGFASKLDYLQELGVTAIWILPFYPSPWKDDGYDISDYTQVHPAYGTLSDFKFFLREAHRRGLRIITELVLNHTSDQHAWFQRSRRAHSGSIWRDFYVWSETPEKYKDARIIFKDFEASNWTWDPVANAYYWHRFYSHQPDLNFDNPEVHRSVLKVVDFWLDMGVDGLRLDAVPYLYEREGSNCENLPETYEFLKKLRHHIDAKYQDRMLLAEANQWPEDAVAYLGNGDACHMAFHFPLMPRMFMSVRMEDRYPIIDILEQTPQIPENAQWALFLRNHDELTLEMVTDEERDYMYRMYAHDPRARINLGIRHRLAPLLGKDRKKIELMNAMLLSFPGTPVIYYGDEIGMGDNIYLGDRNGVRTPMQWSADRNAGFSNANPQKLFLPIIIDPDYHYEVVNVEARQNNLHSPLWFMKRLIAQRKRYQAFGRGTLEFLHPENRKVLSFIRRHGEEVILVIMNMSRYAQYVELDLSAYRGMVPMEVFGQSAFPPIGELPYLVTLGPHAFYWFALQTQAVTTMEPSLPAAEPVLAVAGSWDSLFKGKTKDMLGSVLSKYLMTRRWFGGKARKISFVTVQDAIRVLQGSNGTYLILVSVSYAEGDPETYALPVSLARGKQAEAVRKHSGSMIIASVTEKKPAGSGVLYEATADRNFGLALLETIEGRRRHKGDSGDLVGGQTRVFQSLRGGRSRKLEPSALRAEQSNSSILYGNKLVLKLFRKVSEGVNPDLEIGTFLTEQTRFQNIPPIAGSLEYQPKKGTSMTLGLLQSWIKNEGDAWTYTLDILSRYFERVASSLRELPQPPDPSEHLLDLVERKIPVESHELIGSYPEAARLLGQRTAELHLSLASETEDPKFAPEPFSLLYQRSVYQSMRNLSGQVLELLRRRMRELAPMAQAEAARVLDLKSSMLKQFQKILGRKITAMRTRIHGDYHLGQVLYTGRDFIIIDFEGEPARPLSERTIKRSPLRDVAGMLRSFHYAAHTALFDQVHRGVVRSEDVGLIEPWASFWSRWISSAFLKAYLEVARTGGFLPVNRDQLQVLLDIYLIDKSIYELGYELNNRPDWVRVPLKGILELTSP
ncbi:MAG: maltose alpha-D-glucosyltransferase [Acidobacteriota bacterium]